MPFKKFVRESERVNKFEHAKIIAIVNQDGEVMGYDYTLTQYANDFFADPEDRRKYKAITVRSVICESMSELQEKARVALTYLRLGAALTTSDAKKTMKRLKEHLGSADWHNHVNDCGMMLPLSISEDPSPLGIKVSPWARKEQVNFAYAHSDYLPHLRVVSEELKEAEYKLGDRIQLCIVPGQLHKGRKRRKNIWVTVVACHDEMWTQGEEDDEEDDYFIQDVFIGRDGAGELIQFNPKHVIVHIPSASTDSDKLCGFVLRKVVKSSPPESESETSESESESESDNDDPEPVLGEQLPARTILYSECKKGGMAHPMANCLIPELRRALGLMPEQQSDASPPESEPKPEQSDEAAAAPAPEVAPAEQIVPPPALTLRRRCDRPGWKPRQ